MKMNKYLVSLGLMMGLSLLFGCAKAASEDVTKSQGRLVVEHMKLPARFRREDGSFYIAYLDAIVARPDDDQVHPLAVINHGYDPNDYKVRYIDDFKYQTIEFARRGWVAVAFSRRGYGHSEGDFSEKVSNCGEAAVVQGAIIPTEDIKEVIRLMKQSSYVDGSKVLAIGHSGGGYAMLALAANPPPGLVAAINFAGAVAGATPDYQSCLTDVLLRAVAKFGRTARIPMLWIYAENDRYSPIVLGKKMYDVFVGKGGNAEFVNGIWYGYEGHNLFFKPESISVWTPYVDAFLQKNGLKLRENFLSARDAMEVVDGEEVGH